MHKCISVGLLSIVVLFCSCKTVSDEYVDKAREHIENNDYRKALKDLDTAIRLDDEQINAWILKSNVFIQMGNYKMANKCIDEARHIEPSNRKLWLMSGDILLKLKCYEYAYGSYGRVLAYEPGNYNALAKSGFVMVELNRLEKAIGYFQKALSIKKNFSPAYKGLGIVFFKHGYYERAINNFDNALKNGDRGWDVLYYRGLTLLKKAKHKEAVSDFKRAIEIDSNNPLLYNNLGLAYKDLGNIKKSISVYEKAIQIEPEYWKFYYNLARCYSILDNKKNALVFLGKALEKGCNDLKLVEEESFNNIRKEHEFCVLVEGYRPRIKDLNEKLLIKSLKLNIRNLIDYFVSKYDVWLIYKSGTKSIDLLVERLDSESEVLHFFDPMGLTGDSPIIFSGMNAAFMIELILGKGGLTKESIEVEGYVLGEKSNYIYDKGVILRNSDKKLLEKADLKKIKEIYGKWWEKNKHKSIEMLRKEWKEGKRPLTGSEYTWW